MVMSSPYTVSLVSPNVVKGPDTDKGKNDENVVRETKEPSAPSDVPKKSKKEAVKDAASVPHVEVKAEKKPDVPLKKVRPANCESCNKSIKDKWYYRNGKFYCTKQCFKTTAKKEKAQAPSADKPQA